MRKLTHWMLCFCTVMMMAGCAEQAYYPDPEQSQAVTLPNTDMLEVMSVAEKILEQMHFTISQMDM